MEDNTYPVLAWRRGYHIKLVLGYVSRSDTI